MEEPGGAMQDFTISEPSSVRIRRKRKVSQFQFQPNSVECKLLCTGAGYGAAGSGKPDPDRMSPEEKYPEIPGDGRLHKVLQSRHELEPKIGEKILSRKSSRLTFLQLLTKLDFVQNNLKPANLPRLISLMSTGNLFWFRIVISLFSLLIFISSSLPKANAVLYQQSKCETFGWNAFPVWKYRAKPRHVSPLHIDRHMQKEFLKLFRGHGYYDDSSSEEDSYEDFPLDIRELQRVADMCPRDGFYYSLSPNHLEATIAIVQMFVAQPSPPDVLKLAKALLKSPYVNPKVWYYGLVGAAQERTDMTGFQLPHLIDAMPDLFVPAPLLYAVMDKYRSALEERSGIMGNATTTTLRPKKRKPLQYHRGKRALPFTLNANLTNTFRNSVKRFIRKFALGKNETKSTHNSRKGKGEGVPVKVKMSASKITSRNNTRSDRSLKYKSSSPSPSQSSRSIGSYKVIRKSKGKKSQTPVKKGKKKPEVHKGNATQLMSESGTSWLRARTDSDAFDDCIVVDGNVGVHNGYENKLWYFREDMMVNQHHWYWHQEYPLNATKHRPRRAELFFYMHRNLVARYNAERYSNGMPFVRPFDIRPGAEIPSAYEYPIADVKSGQFWTPRPHGINLMDIIHEEDPNFERNIFIGRYNELYWRLIRSIKVGSLLTGPIHTLNIRHTKGIEPLGNTVEASDLNVNPVFYDAMGFHNLGHQLIGLSTDPLYEKRLPPGVMADTSTTMRDPEFYTYHALVDGIFDKYKKSLPPYRPYGGEYPLRWDGVEILDIEVISKNAGRNELQTFWTSRKFELAPGVDQSIHKGDLDVDVCAVHLNHQPFDFKITVTLDPCAKTESNKGTVRLFLAPRYDDHGHRLSLTQQRRLMIHLDAFPVDLRVGKNIIYRRSYDSSALAPWTKHLKDLEHQPKHQHSADFCGCGWPTHLYIPKGSPEGTPFDLFAMITNFDHDYVEDHPDDLSIPEPCNSPYLYCGVKWRQYPDAKPMGYPFDRLPFKVPFSCPKGVASIWTLVLCKLMEFFFLRPVATLEEFVSYAPNMGATVVNIRHIDHLVW